MISTKLASIGLAASLVAILPAIAAQAAGRTFVSTAGSDSNPCTIALPCRNLQAAYNAVAANGQVDVLDPGNYGSLTITGPVSIQGHGWAGMSTNIGAAITINAVSGNVNIIGVVLDGLGITGTNGIQFNSGGALTVRDSVIRNFMNYGLHFVPNSSTLSQLYVSNTLVSDSGEGIAIVPAGSGGANGVLDHVEMENNFTTGLEVTTSTQTVKVTVSDSVSANNGTTGANANSSGGLLKLMVRNSTFANNHDEGLEATGTGATIRVTRSTITGNGAGWAITTGGVVTSYADNNIDDNGSANTEPTNPLTYK